MFLFSFSWRTVLLSLALSAVSSAGQVLKNVEDTRSPPTVKNLVDPAVLAKSDGKTRPGELPGTMEAYLPAIFPSSHAANLIELHNGDVLCAWFSGTWEGNSDVGIVISRLAKGSTKWSQTRLIDNRDGESFQNPVIFEAPDGSVHLFHTTQGAGAGEANAQVLHVLSKDHGKTWSAPELLFEKPGSFTRHPLLVLKDGTWLLPLTYVTSYGIGEGAETNYSSVMLSKDAGKSWKECLIEGSQGKVQPSAILDGSNGLVIFYRDRASNHIYRSTSVDGCRWSTPEPGQLPNNNASVQAFQLRNGHTVIAFDNSAANRSGATVVGGLRKPLSVAVSKDGGVTWVAVRDVEIGRPGYGAAEGSIKQPGREEYSYPSIIQLRSGRIMVAYTYRRQTIKVVSFSEDWLTKGNSVGLYQR
jgi:predicted neuraminidase